MDGMTRDPAKNDELILVDGLDRPLGSATKERAHREGLLHRAFSVVLVRKGEGGPEVLLAQRAHGKYHSGGLWGNSCCSHPRVGENVPEAASRRVPEELGCQVSDLREIAAFAYRAVFEGGLAEHEYDHVLLGRAVGELAPASDEVMAVRWVGVDDLARELAEHPEHFAAWAPMVLSLALPEILRAR